MIGHLLWITFGPGTWGAGGNMLAWVICGGLGFAWLRGKMTARDLARELAAEKRHAEQMKAAAGAHQIVADLFERHTGSRHPAAPDSESEAE